MSTRSVDSLCILHLDFHSNPNAIIGESPGAFGAGILISSSLSSMPRDPSGLRGAQSPLSAFFILQKPVTLFLPTLQGDL